MIYKVVLPKNIEYLRQRDKWFERRKFKIIQRSGERLGNYGTMYSRCNSVIDDTEAEMIMNLIKDEDGNIVDRLQ